MAETWLTPPSHLWELFVGEPEGAGRRSRRLEWVGELHLSSHDGFVLTKLRVERTR